MNRILILHVNRCGSTRLSKSLSLELNTTHYPSPFRSYILNQPKEFSFYFNNPCILQERVINEPEERLRQLIEGFDKVILLTRRELNKAIESWAYVAYHRNKVGSHFNSHTTKYVWEKTPNYQEIKLVLESADKLLKDFSNDYNIPITYYEDLYYNTPLKTVDNFELPIDSKTFISKYLKTEYRQRVENRQSVI